MRARVAAAAACAAMLLPAAAQMEEARPMVRLETVRRVGMDEYRQRLAAMQAAVAACEAAHTAEACNAGDAAEDVEVATQEGARQAHFAWVRRALADGASGKGEAKKDAAGELAAARERIGQELAPAEARGAGVAVGPVRERLRAVLAEREFQRTEQGPDQMERARVAALRWLIEHLGNVAEFGGKNSWLSQMVVGVTVAVPCALLLWWVMVEMRRQRAPVALHRPAGGMAPSAREWQRWLAEAEGFAREGRWREAVHHTYWAAISRLEAQGMWPADRARTPREYLRLLEDGCGEGRQDGLGLGPGLAGLTRSFERIWYGNRPAGEREYREARAWMEMLVAR